MIRRLAALAWLCAVATFAQEPRLPRQILVQTASAQGIFRDSSGLGLGGVAVSVQNLDTGQTLSVSISGDGVFRILNLPPGRYSLRAERDGFQPLERSGIMLNAGEIFAAEFAMVSYLLRLGPCCQSLPRAALSDPARRAAGSPAGDSAAADYSSTGACFTPVPDRWKFDWPDYHRYGPRDEVPYVKGHWYDPFNRNKLKGDYPIFGQRTFLNLNLVSDTAVTGRKLPVPSGVGSDDPDSSDFFGRMGQFAYSQNFSFSAALFHGDTAYRPLDWQIKFTPEINVNYLKVRENGIVSPDVRAGTTRLDAHAGKTGSVRRGQDC